MQIRTLFPVCMFALSAMAACLGGWLLIQAMLDYQRVDRLKRAVDIDMLWFTVADRLAVERPMAGDALLADGPASAESRAAFVPVRQAADEAFAAIEKQILALSYPGADHQLDVVRATRADLMEWRNKVSIMMMRPKSERDPDVFSHYVVTLNAMFERLDRALDLGDVAASQQDGLTMDLIALSRQAWALRRVVGARTVPLMAAQNDRITLDARQIQEQDQFDGTIETQWAAIDAFVLRLPDYPDVAQTVATARAVFAEHDALCHRLIAAERDGRLSGVAAIEISNSIVRTAPTLTAIRDAALAAARARVEHNRLEVTLSLVTSATVVLLTMAATMQMIRLLRRRIVAPVLALTEAIDLLARRHFAVEIPSLGRGDEIGRMAAALETLRRAAIVAAENEAKIIRMARHDSLTGLANRALLNERIEQAMALAARGQPCAVLCLDLDRFKAVNDTFGHPTGDALLKAVAERLMLCVRDSDTISRLGGDEFVVLLVALTEITHTGVIAERITTTLSLPFDLDGQQVTIGASVGIAVAPQDATSAVELLKNADTALYLAKMEDKGSYRYFKPEMHAKLQARMELEKALRDALQTEAFELFYQPLYALIPDHPAPVCRLCGFEALLRWHHPTLGLLGPGQFIPVAEETGLIVPIGAWVLQQACVEAMNWPDTVTVAVNLSAVQFKTPAIVATVRQALETTGLAASRLDLEITESVLLDNSSATLAMLRDLHELGASISMDDFGTGYSSLSYLRSFPFDKIKIDQSFVRDLSEREDARAIVRAVLALGHSLGMKTLAEGVETQDQLTHLWRKGCDQVQGYLFSKPLPASEARPLANRGAHDRQAAATGWQAPDLNATWPA